MPPLPLTNTHGIVNTQQKVPQSPGKEISAVPAFKILEMETKRDGQDTEDCQRTNIYWLTSQ